MPDTYTPAQEAALLRDLRDIGDGHLTLWIDPDDYDLTHGPQRTPMRAYSDRPPAAGTPTPHGAWWEPLVRHGWIAVHVSAGRPYYRITSAGISALTS